MIRILFCEDNKEDLFQIQNYLKNVCLKLKLDVQFYIYEKGLDLDIFDVVFLDMELEDQNGLELGAQLKKETLIIIVSRFKKYLEFGYHIHACRYFLKPLQKEYFETQMEWILKERFLSNNEYLLLKHDPYKVLFEDIMYVDIYNRKLVLFCRDGKQIQTNFTLNQFKQNCPQNLFVQIYRSILVNMNYIKEIQKTVLILQNNNKIPISRRMKKEVERKYQFYLQRL
ncbi:LytR/AlgR family response regulator transcription factor [Floccifex sp.]|uniref:LytR/AlgR family response regulator transcription factor n=1 Tax=Floccifex sp. TaxID=2815810 RepID=UPI003F10F47C